jgi:transcriptional regulator with XRE-family HTH domain
LQSVQNARAVHKAGTPNRLKELRESRGLRQVDVAKAADKDQSVLHRYETGATQIPDDVKARLALFYGVSRAYLMGWEDDPHSLDEEREAA